MIAIHSIRVDNSAEKHISTAGDESIVGSAEEGRAPTSAVLHRKTPSTKYLASPTSGSMEKMGMHCTLETLHCIFALSPSQPTNGQIVFWKREGLVSLVSHRHPRLHLELQLGSR